MKVEVYKNLHKSKKYNKPVYSIRDAKTKRVICWSDKVFLSDAEFVVGQGGRDRVLKEGRKNVHAFIRGNIKIPLTPSELEGDCSYVDTNLIFHKDMSPVANFIALVEHNGTWLTDFFMARRGSYNPYKYNYFYDVETHAKLIKADIALLDETGLCYSNPAYRHHRSTGNATF